MWNIIASSVAGTSHKRLNTECQDYCSSKKIVIGDKPSFAICIADGAGSAQHSKIGATMAVEFALSRIQQSQLNWGEINLDWANILVEETVTYLSEMAAQQSLSIKDFACTFLLGLFCAEVGCFIQIGDGCWVIGNAGNVIAPTWPFSGEYANETVFLTSPDVLDSLQFTKINEPLEYVAGFTDGLQNLLLDFSNRQAFSGFFVPFISSVHSASDKQVLDSQLALFLDSDRVNDRTDDDKTFAFAWRDA